MIKQTINYNLTVSKVNIFCSTCVKFMFMSLEIFGAQVSSKLRPYTQCFVWISWASAWIFKYIFNSVNIVITVQTLMQKYWFEAFQALAQYIDLNANISIFCQCWLWNVFSHLTGLGRLYPFNSLFFMGLFLVHS